MSKKEKKYFYKWNQQNKTGGDEADRFYSFIVVFGYNGEC